MVVFLILGGAHGHHVEWRAGGRPLYLCSGIGRVHDRAGGHRCCPPGGGHQVRVTDRGRHECVVAGGRRSRGRMHVPPGGGGLRGAAGGCVCFVDTGASVTSPSAAAGDCSSVEYVGESGYQSSEQDAQDTRRAHAVMAAGALRARAAAAVAIGRRFTRSMEGTPLVNPLSGVARRRISRKGARRCR